MKKILLTLLLVTTISNFAHSNKFIWVYPDEVSEEDEQKCFDSMVPGDLMDCHPGGVISPHINSPLSTVSSARFKAMWARQKAFTSNSEMVKYVVNEFNNSINNMVILRNENDYGCYRMVSRKRALRLYNEGKIKLVYSV